MAAPSGEHDLVLFDGVCNLCNASVNYVLDRDPAGRFQFAPLQGETARARLAALGKPLPQGDPESIVLVSGGRVFEESTAALRIARRLSGPVKLLAVFLVVPRPIRDLVYRFIARRRYRWFGRSAECRRPTPAVKARFLA